MKEIKEAEAIEAKRAALDPETEARRRKAVVALGGKMGWDDGVEAALKKASERSDDGWIVTLVSVSSWARLNSRRKSPRLTLAPLPCSNQKPANLQNYLPNFPPNHLALHSILTPLLHQLHPHLLHPPATLHETPFKLVQAESEVSHHLQTQKKMRRERRAPRFREKKHLM